MTGAPPNEETRPIQLGILLSMAVSFALHRWTLEEYLLAWEAGALGNRVELLDGEVWDVPVGRWHGRTTMRVGRALPNDRFEITTVSLPTGGSLPDPDCTVLRMDAEPVEQLSPRMQRWAAEDVLLVVEVSDETVAYDLGRKAEMYAEAGFRVYWVVTQDGVHVHSEPTPSGYVSRVLYRPGQHVPVPYADGVTLDVGRLIGA